jgi:hypothetical protein
MHICISRCAAISRKREISGDNRDRYGPRAADCRCVLSRYADRGEASHALLNGQFAVPAPAPVAAGRTISELQRGRAASSGDVVTPESCYS